MVAGCGNKCVKYSFFFFNFLFFVFGALILALALWARFDNEFQHRLGNILTDANLSNVQLSQVKRTSHLPGAGRST
uniref:Uncharacterized protein n=1 Tax=Plectus sambesii TaxID=2011161 RepID=A0A914WGE9_9BILA